MLALCSALIVLLALYALGHYACVVAFAAARPRPRPFDGRPDAAVTVLIPARNEGARAERAIRSVLAQDHAGPVHVRLLVRDPGDDAIPGLARAFGVDPPREAPDPPVGAPAGAQPSEPSVEALSLPAAASSPALGASVGIGLFPLLDEGLRSADVFFAGVDAKAAKINAAVPAVASPFVAILDCDHEADPDWIRSSLELAGDRAARIVQGRRRPIDARGLFALWDSLHQHIGCELFNVAFSRLGLTCFFTGTTALLDTSLLRKRPLGPSLTEDIDLSYALLMDGVRVAANPWSGSVEEVSPDLYSFLARRRRWSNGHTGAFFASLPRLFAAPLRPAEKLQFLLHGAHYLVSAIVFVLHALIALVFVRGLSEMSIATGVLVGLVSAGAVARNQRTADWKGRAAELGVAWAWFTPGFLIAMNLLQATLMGDFPRAALPIPEPIQVAGVLGFVAPLVLLLAGLAGYGQLGGGTLLAVVLTYPIAFYVDILGVLFGLSDRVIGGATWRRVSRAGEAPDAPPPPLRALSIRESWRLRTALSSILAFAGSLMSRRSRWAPALVASALFTGGVIYFPTTRIPAEPARCTVSEHDGHPWIVPPARLPRYCPADGEGAAAGLRTGTFRPLRDDDLATVDPRFWEKGDKTFFCNLAQFDPKNVLPHEGFGVRLRLQADATADKGHTAGHLVTKDHPDGRFTYGRFEVTMQAVARPGVLSAMFLYRFDPWQEIDLEFAGNDTSKVLLNVFYNPGEEGDLYNYGYRGTPVLVDLGFDAAAAPHTYAIEWEQEQIRWFVDGRLVHARGELEPTPIPHLPMRFHVNAWPVCSEELAGKFEPPDRPLDMVVRRVAIARWAPPPVLRLRNWAERRTPANWRADAGWMAR